MVDLDREVSDEELKKFNEDLNKVSKREQRRLERKQIRLNKAYQKKLRATYYNEKINKLLGIKSKVQKTIAEIDRDFIYKSSFKERVMGVFGTVYMQIFIVMPSGIIKPYKLPIKEGLVTIGKKDYVISLKSIVKFKGRPTLFYFYNNPHPITYDTTQFKILVDAESLHNLFNTKFIGQLFSGAPIGAKTIMWSAGVIIALGFVGIIIFALLKDTIVPPDKIFLLPPFIFNYLKNKCVGVCDE